MRSVLHAAGLLALALSLTSPAFAGAEEHSCCAGKAKQATAGAKCDPKCPPGKCDKHAAAEKSGKKVQTTRPAEKKG